MPPPPVDGALHHHKLIAIVDNPELLPIGGVRGFPHWGTWMEATSWFHSDVTVLLDEPDTPGKVSVMATRITGSPDLSGARWDAEYPGFLAMGRRPAFVVHDAKTEVALEPAKPPEPAPPVEGADPEVEPAPLPPPLEVAPVALAEHERQEKVERIKGVDQGDGTCDGLHTWFGG